MSYSIEISPIIIALIALFGSLLGSYTTAYFARENIDRERQRNSYAEAYKAVIEWREMSFRIKRRATGTDVELRERFHDLQEKLAFHEGWIASESNYMATQYRTLIEHVKNESREPIKQAWNIHFLSPDEHLTETSELPSKTSQEIIFLECVRIHLSSNIFVKAKYLFLRFRSKQV